MSRVPPRRVPIVPHTLEKCIDNYTSDTIIIKDKEKINKIIELANELDLPINVTESGSDFSVYIIIQIPYIRKVIIKK